MNVIHTIVKLVVAAIFISTVSCEKNEKNYINGDLPDDFLFNVPINHDTILIDRDYNIDFRVEIEGQKIDSANLIIDYNQIIKRNTSIISSNSLSLSEGFHTIQFLIRSVDLESGNIIFYKSTQMNLLVIENLSNRYVATSINNGRLRLTWPELDKKNTTKYLIERFMGEDMEYSQEFETQDSIYLDNYYVGEEANFRISVINTEGKKQNIWYYKKAGEKPSFSLSQNPLGGYNIHYSKCKYYAGFGKYYLTADMNNNPDFTFSTTTIEDTICHIANAKFADEARLWISYLPKEFPRGISEQDWILYGKFLYSRYGISNFEYDRIRILNNENVVYTSKGNIFKFNTTANQKTDSIINKNARYGFLQVTPAGNYIYATDENIYGSPVYFWPSGSFPTNPEYVFYTDFTVPPVSDNLLAFMGVPSATTSSKLAIYNVTDGSRIYTTNYENYGTLRRVSSNGEFFLTDQSALKLFSYSNNTFHSIYIENNWLEYYDFFDFNPLDNGICYVWNSDKKFSTRSTSDFSEISSFPLDLYEIVNIDYYSKKIMGYVTDKIRIYNLDNGTLEKEIPANLTALFAYSNNAILLGNTVYSNYGIKYIIEE